MRRNKFHKISLVHLAVLSAFALFNNCSGFSAQELANVQSLGSSGSTGAPTPTPSPTATPGPIATPTAGAPMKKVFFANGYQRRTMMSCDDGQTWINDHSDNDAARCNIAGDPNEVECTHTGSAGITIDSGDGYFFADYGWGAVGSARMTRDGVNWQEIKNGSWGGGMLYAAHKLWLLWDNWFLSSDLGATWINSPATPPNIYADHPIARKVGTKFFAVSRDNGVAISRDQGYTWELPSLQSNYANTGIAEGNGALVAVGTNFNNTTRLSTLISARSIDDGLTWTTQTVEADSQFAGWSEFLFNGHEFMGWSFLAVWKSTDGINWTRTPIRFDQPVNQYSAFGKVAYNPSTGTYVTIGIDQYDKQRISRSSDGINWTLVDPSKFKGGHGISGLIVGDMEAKYCP